MVGKIFSLVDFKSKRRKIGDILVIGEYFLFISIFCCIIVVINKERFKNI